MSRPLALTNAQRTPERVDLARGMVAQLRTWREVLEAVNALPGPRIPSTDRLQHMLADIGITRARLVPGYVSHTPPKPTASPRQEAREASVARDLLAEPSDIRVRERDGAPSPAASLMRSEHVEQSRAWVTLADALRWGERNGVPWVPGEMAGGVWRRINARRGDLGLPKFALLRGRIVAPLPAAHVGG